MNALTRPDPPDHLLSDLKFQATPKVSWLQWTITIGAVLFVMKLMKPTATNKARGY